MTAVVDVTARVLDTPESSGSRVAWTQWLTERLEPGWRPGEWNPQTWFFDGDPANELTGVGLCEVLVRGEDRRATYVHGVPEDLPGLHDVPGTVRHHS